MACEIERPTPATLFQRIRDMFSVIVLGGSPIIPESNEWYATSLEYAIEEEFYSVSEQQWKERDPRYACCENLIAMAAQDGVVPRAASFASGYVTLTGAAGAALPASLDVTIGTKTYTTAAPLPSVMPASGTLTIRVQATEPGLAGNGFSPPGSTPTTGTLATAVPGVNSTVAVNGNRFCGGREQELCEEFRTRYIDRMKYKPRATSGWIEQKLLEWPCVTRVCIRGGHCCDASEECGCCNCGEQIQYYVFMEDTFPCGLPPQEAINEMQVWMFGSPQGRGLGQAEIGVCGSLHTATPAYIDVSFQNLTCVTQQQEDEIIAQFQEYFRTLCPSGTLTSRELEAIALPILGSSANFSIALSTPNTDLVQEFNCGMDLNCDVMPCLRNVLFPSVVAPSESCG